MLLETVEVVLGEPCVEEYRSALRGYPGRLEAPLPDAFWDGLESIKAKAVESDQEPIANACWCLAEIGRIQDHYIRAFSQAQAHQFYDSWCELERCEVGLIGLSDVFPLEEGDFGLELISEQVPRFQSLFPYRFFLSPGMVVRRTECSICGQPFQLRGGCSHVVGQIYGGERCLRIIKDIEPQEISIVDKPVNKYAVLFGEEIEYEYGPVIYVVKGLRSPWHRWDYERTIWTEVVERFPGTGRNDPCPCGSGTKYKRCCERWEKRRSHYDVRFEIDPPPDLPSHLEDASYRVRGTPQQGFVVEGGTA